jgi:hypothetical protein
VVQSSLFDGVSFDPFVFKQDGLAASAVHVCWRQVLQAFMVAVVIVVRVALTACRDKYFCVPPDRANPFGVMVE